MTTETEYEISNFQTKLGIPIGILVYANARESLAEFLRDQLFKRPPQMFREISEDNIHCQIIANLTSLSPIPSEVVLIARTAVGDFSRKQLEHPADLKERLHSARDAVGEDEVHNRIIQSVRGDRKLRVCCC